MQNYLGTLLKCCEREFQGNSAGHCVSSVEEAENDLITEKMGKLEKGIVVKEESRQNCLMLQMKALEILRTENKNGQDKCSPLRIPYTISFSKVLIMDSFSLCRTGLALNSWNLIWGVLWESERMNTFGSGESILASSELIRFCH